MLLSWFSSISDFELLTVTGSEMLVLKQLFHQTLRRNLVSKLNQAMQYKSGIRYSETHVDNLRLTCVNQMMLAVATISQY